MKRYNPFAPSEQSSPTSLANHLGNFFTKDDSNFIQKAVQPLEQAGARTNTPDAPVKD